MIKVVAFDLVGVLVREKQIPLTIDEEKIERLFGPNIDDESYLQEAQKKVPADFEIIENTKNLINKLYEVKYPELLKKLKEKYSDIKFIIATNHLSYVRDFIEKEFSDIRVDDIIISAEINKIKPNKEFYEYVLNKYELNGSELLFLDDNVENINGALSTCIYSIKVNKNMDLYEEICQFLDIKKEEI